VCREERAKYLTQDGISEEVIVSEFAAHHIPIACQNQLALNLARPSLIRVGAIAVATGISPHQQIIGAAQFCRETKF